MPSTGSPPADTSRLPPYSTKHRRRSHPYPMDSRPRRPRADHWQLMTTVDYRTGPGGLATIPEEPEAVRLNPAVVSGERPDADVSSLELDGSEVDDKVARAAAESAKFANVLLVLRRKLLALLAVVEYLKGNEKK